MKRTQIVIFCLGIALFVLSMLQGSMKTEEKMKVSPLEESLQRQDEMTSFFFQHQDEMKALALRLRELNDHDPIYHYLYAVKENALIRFDEEHFVAQGKDTEHPILSGATFLRESPAFVWVMW